jgi:hypothetical protein
MTVCSDPNAYCKTVEQYDIKGNLYKVAKSCSSSTTCPSYTSASSGNCKVNPNIAGEMICSWCNTVAQCACAPNICPGSQPQCPSCSGTDQTSCDAKSTLITCPNAYAICRTDYLRDNKGTIYSFTRSCGSYQNCSLLDAPTDTCTPNSDGSEACYQCSTKAPSCATGASCAANVPPYCPSCSGTTLSGVENCAIKQCLTPKAQCLVSYNVDVKGNMMTNSYSAGCLEANMTCPTACSANPDGTESCYLCNQVQSGCSKTSFLFLSN